MTKKETIKQFLKPNLRKILLFIILFLIIPTKLIILGPLTLPIVPFGGFQVITTLLRNILLIDHGVSIFSWINWSWALSSLIFSYFISCLTIFAYNKFKGRKL